MIYNISDEPNYGFKRKVEVDLIYIGLKDYVSKNVNLHLSVKYYESDGLTPITIIPAKIVVLKADQTTWVDATGTIVPEGDPTAVMTEYDFFLALMNVPVIISDIVESKVMWADSLGRFN
ncbi:MAG: hypothetical protein EBU90_19780 [Proteobacteria bacterium]|jgi:hypothetical protein|nr:hypothetical protein [Pseudomonadota bacterium]